MVKSLVITIRSYFLSGELFRSQRTRTVSFRILEGK